MINKKFLILCLFVLLGSITFAKISKSEVKPCLCETTDAGGEKKYTTFYVEKCDSCETQCKNINGGVISCTADEDSNPNHSPLIIPAGDANAQDQVCCCKGIEKDLDPSSCLSKPIKDECSVMSKTECETGEKRNQDTPPARNDVQIADPLGIGSKDGQAVQYLIGRVISVMMGLVGSLALLMFVYGGFLWMTAAGNEDRVKKGKDVLLWAVAGLFIIFTSYILVYFVLGSLMGLG